MACGNFAGEQCSPLQSYRLTVMLKRRFSMTVSMFRVRIEVFYLFGVIIVVRDFFWGSVGGVSFPVWVSSFRQWRR